MATAVVTGANRGIGLALCRQLQARGDRVIGVCRTRSEPLDQLGITVHRGVDVSDDLSVAQMVASIDAASVDLLFNNAGMLTQETLADLDFPRIRRQFEVNALGPLRVTSALLPRLVQGSKIALITSRMGSIADNASGSSYGYRMSKAALNIAGVSLARDLYSRGIAVILIHPGFVRTEMTQHSGHIDSHEAARGILARIGTLTIGRRESSGTKTVRDCPGSQSWARPQTPARPAHLAAPT